MAFLSGTTLDGYKVVTASREYTVIYEGRSERLARELFSLCWANGMLPRIFDKPVDGYGYRVYGTRVAGFSEALEQHKNSLRSEADEYIVLPDSPENLKVNTSHQGYSCVRNWWTRDSVVCKESSMKKLGLEYDPDFIALRVSQVTHGQGEVFDVEVDESHDYLVDGVVSHNTVNVPAEYPFEDFQGLYREAWKAGLKGLATYRPNAIVGQVLVAEPAPAAAEQAFDETDPDRRLRLEHVPEPALASLRWRRRPRPPAGNPAWTYFVEHGLGSFAVFVGHWDAQEESQDWPGLSGSQPFEVWVNGAEQPRGLAALAKSLSMDMRSNDRGWLETKLKSLMKAHGDDGFMLAMPPDGEPVRVPSLVAGFAKLVHHRCQELGAFEAIGETPVLDALMSPKEPKTGTEGTLSWTVDIHNPATCDDFVMGLKELSLPNGQRRPYSVWLSGEYPKVLDGLCKSLSYDMRVVDPAWIGAKLRQLLDFPEPRGDFLAWVPGERRKVSYPSTVAYLCRLVLHRYAMLGILDEEGFPVDEMGVMVEYGPPPRPEEAAAALAARPGKPCPECGNHAVIRKDGCDFCTACGAIGACG
jgi:ribonucleoside-diphosphate reductase alpha chain